MAKPRYPRPGFETDPAPKRGEVISALDMDALIAAGIAPATIAFGNSQKTADPKTEADIVESEVIRDVIADDLSHGEALTFAAAFWQGAHRANAERARSVWRILTFMNRHPNCGWSDVPPDLLDSSFFCGYAMPRKNVSSLIHWWFANGSFARAESQLNALSLKRWSEHRRQQMSAVVAWEKAQQARTTAKRKARLFKNVKRDSRVSAKKERSNEQPTPIPSPTGEDDSNHHQEGHQRVADGGHRKPRRRVRSVRRRRRPRTLAIVMGLVRLRGEAGGRQVVGSPVLPRRLA